VAVVQQARGSRIREADPAVSVTMPHTNNATQKQPTNQPCFVRSFVRSLVRALARGVLWQVPRGRVASQPRPAHPKERLPGW
jgi:hypothetical protein